ncbi:MAG TPA: hypothetical protein VLT87_09450 [Thermoanaerobaculia bacterium]|nr:hypothetical protein [Thermoanaerobaculia bacterium]
MERKLEKTVGLASGAAAAVTFGLALRPLFLNWGATDEEVHRFWPGDELSPRPASEATRAITIHAPGEAVWPWIVQIGQDRGGFYSYTWLENLFGARIRNADRILPEHQSRQVGDTVWMTPRERYGGKGCSRVARIEPGRDMVLVTPDDYDSAVTKGFAPNGTWAFLLDPVDEGTTRLVVRSRSGPKADPFRFLIFDPAHFIMEWKMMRGIRDRAEAEAARGIEARAA